jgi:glycosyltransferase involved in cell wall biosynthesis
VVVVAGGALPGDKAQYYKRLENKALATPGVRWLGYRPDVAELIADLDVLVMASTEPEPFGLVVVEALACGVPVVASNHGGPPEILAAVEPTASRLVPPGDVTSLAEAVLALLPEAGSNAASRCARAVLRVPTTPDFGAHFDAVAAGGRRRRRARPPADSDGTGLV